MYESKKCEYVRLFFLHHPTKCGYINFICIFITSFIIHALKANWSICKVRVWLAALTNHETWITGVVNFVANVMLVNILPEYIF